MAKYCYFNLSCRIACAKCRKRKHREQHPLRTTYTDLKANARARQIPFSLSLIDFTRFCLSTNYLQLKGRQKEDMTIDRIKVVNEDGTVRGYDRDNLQMLTKTENNKKQTQDQKDRYSKLKLVRDPQVPF